MSNLAAERRNMVDTQIRPQAVTNPRLLKALYEIKREAFLPPSLRPLAYMEGALQVEAARTGHAARFLLAPMVFAKLAQLAEIRATDKVLDVGPATGYSTAVLSRLADSVVAVECDAGLAALARETLTEQSVGNAVVRVGPLQKGAPDDGPFQVILVNGRLHAKPDVLLAQLAPDGRLVAVIGGDTTAKAVFFKKTGTSVESVNAFDTACHPLPGFEAEHNFTF